MCPLDPTSLARAKVSSPLPAPTSATTVPVSRVSSCLRRDISRLSARKPNPLQLPHPAQTAESTSVTAVALPRRIDFPSTRNSAHKASRLVESTVYCGDNVHGISVLSCISAYRSCSPARRSVSGESGVQHGLGGPARRGCGTLYSCSHV